MAQQMIDSGSQILPEREEEKEAEESVGAEEGSE
jgi:hypothetical protein